MIGDTGAHKRVRDATASGTSTSEATGTARVAGAAGATRTTGAAGLRIRPLEVGDEESALENHRVFAPEGFMFLLQRSEGEAWRDYVAKIAAQERGEQLPEGWVPAAFRVADVGGRVVGRLGVRFELTAHLAEFGGHIGYGVHPEFRRRGIATALLQHGLRMLAERGIRHALVTCDKHNTGSRRTIERCGGRPDPQKPRAYDAQHTVLRFLVPTTTESMHDVSEQQES